MVICVISVLVMVSVNVTPSLLVHWMSCVESRTYTPRDVSRKCPNRLSKCPAKQNLYCLHSVKAMNTDSMQTCIMSLIISMKNLSGNCIFLDMLLIHYNYFFSASLDCDTSCSIVWVAWRCRNLTGCMHRLASTRDRFSIVNKLDVLCTTKWDKQFYFHMNSGHDRCQNRECVKTWSQRLKNCDCQTCRSISFRNPLLTLLSFTMSQIFAL